MNFKKQALLFLSIVLSACSSTDQGLHNDYVIGQYTAPETAYSSNSFWIEGPEGIVLIDTQFLPSQALQAVDIAESYTGKKVVLAIVLHASVERFNGVQALQAKGIKVVSARQVVDGIAEAHNKTWPIFYQRLKPDYPDSLVLPEVAWEKTTVFSAAGLDLKAYVIRQALGPAHVLIELDDHLFTGALVTHQSHAWPGGDTVQWLERLDEISDNIRAKVIHPGRGYSMNATKLLTQQKNYLQALQSAVARFYTGGEITAADTTAIQAEMTRQFPAYGFEKFLRYTIPAEWKRLRQDDHQMMKGQGAH
ncbi:MAG: hydrolase [Gammaproteobacteria bacterium]|nr:hydrolase [Gammaproteobacteria bacterium]